jgi:hypothetical protein
VLLDKDIETVCAVHCIEFCTPKGPDPRARHAPSMAGNSQPCWHWRSCCAEISTCLQSLCCAQFGTCKPGAGYSQSAVRLLLVVKLAALEAYNRASLHVYPHVSLTLRARGRAASINACRPCTAAAAAGATFSDRIYLDHVAEVAVIPKESVTADSTQFKQGHVRRCSTASTPCCAPAVAGSTNGSSAIGDAADLEDAAYLLALRTCK